jgi:hypothetical protein
MTGSGYCRAGPLIQRRVMNEPIWPLERANRRRSASPTPALMKVTGSSLDSHFQVVADLDAVAAVHVDEHVRTDAARGHADLIDGGRHRCRQRGGGW